VFGWFKRRQVGELKKLLFQNMTAAERVKLYFEQNGDHQTVVLLEAYSEETQRIAKLFYNGDGKLSLEDTQILLDMNRNIRRLFDNVQALERLFGETPTPRNFDETFKLLRGWESI
jgi:hypothetical protein